MKKIIALLLATSVLFFASVEVCATENTTYTYTVSVNGDWIRTQDAYMPGRISLKELGMSEPSDIFIKDRLMYVADSGNKRLIIYNLDSGDVNFIEKDYFVSPCGIFVDDNGIIFIADSEAEAVFILDNGKEVMRIERPESNLYAKGSDFKPKNVVVTTQGNIFVCANGVSEGIMKFDSKGEFEGYFAANLNTLTLKERLQDLLYTTKQKEAAVARTARPIENIDISENDLVYSVTQSASFTVSGTQISGNSANALKLHNMAGNNILSKDKEMTDENNFVDVVSAKQGRSFALTYSGLINEYDKDGNLIFSFGGRGISVDRTGLFSLAAAIDIDGDGILYVLDKEKGLVQSFIPTDFAYYTYSAIEQMQSGNYKSSKEIWKDLIRKNEMSRLAHLGYGKALYYSGDFDNALTEFKTANDTDYYSDCFWEIRDRWLKNNMPAIIITAVVLIVLGVILAKFKGKTKKEKTDNAFTKSFKNIKTVLRHPIDSVYDIKIGRIGNVTTATLIYIITVAVYLLDVICRGFVFRMFDPQKTTPLILVSALVIPFALWLIGSAMIGSINSGEGSFKNVYIVNAYAVLPYTFGALIITALSHILTNNEGFIVTFGWSLILIWTACNIFACNRELQNYTFGGAVKNTLLTFFFMIMAIVAFAILYILGSQLAIFLKTLLNEVIYRVDL